MPPRCQRLQIQNITGKKKAAPSCSIPAETLHHTHGGGRGPLTTTGGGNVARDNAISDYLETCCSVNNAQPNGILNQGCTVVSLLTLGIMAFGAVRHAVALPEFVLAVGETVQGVNVTSFCPSIQRLQCGLGARLEAIGLAVPRQTREMTMIVRV